MDKHVVTAPAGGFIEAVSADLGRVLTPGLQVPGDYKARCNYDPVADYSGTGVWNGAIRSLPVSFTVVESPPR